MTLILLPAMMQNVVTNVKPVKHVDIQKKQPQQITGTIMQSMETHTLHPYRNCYLTSCTKLSFGEMKLLFSVKNYCPLICLIRRGLEKERLYQISSQIWRQAAPGGCCSLLQPSSWGRNLSSPEADPITASPEETGPEENTAYTNKLTSSSSARSCFLLSLQPFSLSLLFASPSFSTQGKTYLQIREAWRNCS